MNYYKELWIHLRRIFISKMGREPSDQEMNDLMADQLGEQVDRAMEMMRQVRQGAPAPIKSK